MVTSAHRRALGWAALGALTVFWACSGPESGTILDPDLALIAAFDSAGAPAAQTTTTQAQSAAAGGIVLPQRSALVVTLKERNAAWWHELSVVQPENLHLQGPGYLFPGPTFNIGPYDPGPVSFQLDAYNPRSPHQFFGTATYQVTGAFPLWQVRFEDGSDGDFDDIIIEVAAVSTAGLHVDCTPSPINRGAPVDCTASATPAGASLTVLEWTFTGSGGLSATEVSGVNPWSGPLVTDGLVEVRADVDGVEMTASTSVSVQSRNWQNVVTAFSVTEDNPGPLPAMPTVVGDLGKIGFRPGSDASQVTAVATGPNQGLHYLTGIPYTITGIVHVNTVALAQGSSFWQRQASQQFTGPSGFLMCSRQDVVPFQQIVRVHEGTTMAQGSHARFYKDKLDQLAGPALEDVVGGSAAATLVAANPIFQGVMAQAQSESSLADNPQNAPTYCLFQY